MNIKRTYGKFFNTLGEIGGFKEIVMMVFTSMYVLLRIQRDREQILRALTGKLYEPVPATNPETTKPGPKEIAEKEK